MVLFLDVLNGENDGRLLANDLLFLRLMEIEKIEFFRTHGRFGFLAGFWIYGGILLKIFD